MSHSTSSAPTKPPLFTSAHSSSRDPNIDLMDGEDGEFQPLHAPLYHQNPDDATRFPPIHHCNCKTDEGYSADDAPLYYDCDLDKRGLIREQGSDMKLLPWMRGMSVAMREEFAYNLIRTLPTPRVSSLVRRLSPFLHIDFVHLLPSELSLQIFSYLPTKDLLKATLTSRTWRKFALEPRLWRDLYKSEGWDANDEEVREFEQKLRSRHDEEVKQQTEFKRKAVESNVEERKVKEAKRGTPSQQSSGVASSSQTASDFSQGSHDGVEQDLIDFSYGSMVRPSTVRSFNNMISITSDEDDAHQPPHRRSTASHNHQIYTEPPLAITPTLTINPSHGAPRLNWQFLFKNRVRLEENWLRNRCVPFQIPHPVYPHEGHQECIYTIQFSPKWLCSGSRDRSLRVWDIRTRRLRGEPLYGHEGSVLCLQLDESPEEDVIVSGSSDASVIVWRFSTGQKLQVIRKAHGESVLNLRFSRKWLVTCSKDKLIKIWNRFALETMDSDYPWNSKTIFGSLRGTVEHRHNPLYQPVQQVADPGQSSGLDLQNPYASCYIPRVAPVTIPPYTAIQELRGHVAAVNAIQLNGDEIVSASGDRVIKLWNLQTAVCEKTFIGHQKGIACVQFDGKTIVSGSSDQTVRVFDVDTQVELATLRGHGALVRTVQSTENKIVSGSYDESVRVWRREPESGDWIPGPVLRQTQAPVPMPPPRIQSTQMAGHLQISGENGSVQMHHIVGLGGTTLPGAMAASQVLPLFVQNDDQPVVADDESQQLPLPANLAMPFPYAPAVAYNPPPNGSHRVFKLQFDARWIICCSQDHRITGWDYANDEDEVVQASQFFLVDK